MGNVRRMLAAETLEPRTITARQIWSDLCENVHLHFRNLRIDFGELEWAHFRAAINMLGKAVEHTALEEKYEEGDPNFLIQCLFDVLISNSSKYYPDRFLIELENDSSVHIHYRDLRLHLTNGEFKTIAKAFSEALDTHENLEPFKYSEVTDVVRTWIPIDDIQPYDAGHRCMAEDDEHREGIEYVKSVMQSGERIRPILVSTNGQRLDGFKRYMAHKELGLKEIECIVDPFGRMGGQHNQSMIDDDYQEAVGI